MRFLPALLGALLITCAVFLFMQSLIEQRHSEDTLLSVHTPVDIFRNPEQKEKPPEPELREQDTSKDEPAMEDIELGIPAPEASPTLEIPALDLSLGELKLPGLGKRWSAPLGAGGVGVLEGEGVDAQGFVEVVPYNTRNPNVPELAWKNKVSGWVLVAFNVRADGSTRNIRVLDARPRGVFEEKVIAAVSDWRYSVRTRGNLPGDVVMTQKVEVNWEDYSTNIPNVD